jgi:hypothetical protein
VANAQADDLPPALPPLSLPPEAAAPAAPPLPAMTMELNISHLMAPPAHTQELSLAQIEGEMALPGRPGFAVPSHTQEISAADIQATLDEHAKKNS